MTNSKTLINNLKRELKRQGISYADLAKLLGIAESTVKKILAKGNFTLERLDQICDALNVELLDLVENVNEEVTRLSQFTVSQEQRLVDDPVLLVLAYAAINFWTMEDIIHRYALKEHKIVEKMKILEGFGLLELRANNRIRPLVSNNFQWLPDGPLSEYFRSHFLPEFFDHDFRESGALRLIRYGDLTDQSKKQLERKSLELTELFEQLTYQDRHFQPGNRERKGSALVVAYRSLTISGFGQFARE